ncbi:hypothetical protein [Methylotenera sp. L2L1]|uniref:hypothetical protein n=1 Tax=Methylotenera sp. L2L1 TaxID=1502770 RepID=UPI000569EDDF|nr:hypothetical protein [Methylotenera sp. L2L1]
MPVARVNDIKANLEFAFDSNRELSTLIADAQRDDQSIKYLSQKSAAILAAVRECFDYCISDIRDDYLPSETQRVYYPFHPDTLQRGKPLHKLEGCNNVLYQRLLSVASNIQARAVIQGTMCRYSDVRAVNDLVNHKKHDKIIEVCELGRSKSRIDFPNGQSMTVTPMYPIGADGFPDFTKPGAVGPEAWLSTPGVKVTAVKDFFFDNTGIDMSRADIHGFCMTSITAARFVLGEIYHTAYAMPFDTFHERG